MTSSELRSIFKKPWSACKRSVLSLTRNTDTYSYEPIDPHNEIRLLTLRPGPKGSPLKCDLSHHSRRDLPAYEAISYTWGSVNRTQAITIGVDQSTKVTENCLAALQTMRDCKQPRTVWIDSLCIDQHNLDERSAQVAKIGETFRAATCTIVWLGDLSRSHYGAQIVEVLRQVGDKQATAESHRKLLDAVSALLNPLSTRPWFRRTWIIQEVMLSGSIYIAMNDQRLPWWTLEQAHDYGIVGLRPAVVRMHMELSHDYGKRPAYTYAELATSSNYEASDVARTQPAVEPVSFLLCRSQRQIIRHTAPLRAARPTLLAPNYAKSVEQVYIDLAWFLIDYNEPQALSIGCKLRSSQVPSWVADWRCQPLAKEHSKLHRILSWQDAFTAGFRAGHKQIFARRESRFLHLRGRKVDAVRSVSGTWRASANRRKDVSLLREDFSRLNRFLDEWRHAENATSPCPQYRARRQQLPRTVRRRLDLGIVCEPEHASHHHCSACIDSFPNVGPVLMTGVTSERCPDLDLEASPDSQSYFSTLLERIDPSDTSIDIRNLAEILADRCHGARLLESRAGLVGVGPQDAQEGDIICVLLGVPVPFVLRQTEHGYKLVGDCLVSGIMYGEAVNHLNWDRIDSGELVAPLQDFEIC